MRPPTELSSEEKEREKKIAGHIVVYKSWEAMYRRMTWMHYTLGTLSVVFTTVAAAAIMTRFDDLLKEALLVTAAVLTSLTVFYKPSEKADRYRLAWATLGNAIDRYIYRPPLGDSELLEGVRKACQWGDSVVRNNSPLALDAGSPERDERPGPDPSPNKSKDQPENPSKADPP